MDNLKDSASIWQPGRAVTVKGGEAPIELARVQLPDGCSEPWTVTASARISVGAGDVNFYVPMLIVEVSTQNGKVTKFIDCTVRAEETLAGQYVAVQAFIMKRDGTPAPATVTAKFVTAIARGTKTAPTKQTLWLPRIAEQVAGVKGSFLTNFDDTGAPAVGPCRLRRIVWGASSAVAGAPLFLMLFDTSVAPANGDRPSLQFGRTDPTFQNQSLEDTHAFYRGCFWELSTTFDVLTEAVDPIAKVWGEFIQPAPANTQ